MGSGAAGTYSSNPGASSSGASSGSGYRPGGQSGQGARSGGSDWKREAQDRAAEAKERGREYYGEARERAGDYYEEASRTARDSYRKASDWASDSYEHASDYSRQGWNATQRFVNDNPVLIGVVGLATGLLLGALLPRTRQEDRYMGRYADDVREQGMNYARDAVHRGRDYAANAFSEDSEGHATHESEWRQSPDDVAQAARQTSPIAGQYEKKH